MKVRKSRCTAPDPQSRGKGSHRAVAGSRRLGECSLSSLLTGTRAPDEGRVLQVLQIAAALGEHAVLKLMFAALLRARMNWQRARRRVQDAIDIKCNHRIPTSNLHQLEVLTDLSGSDCVVDEPSGCLFGSTRTSSPAGFMPQSRQPMRLLFIPHTGPRNHVRGRIDWQGEKQN